jgi:hypothetical protein
MSSNQKHFVKDGPFAGLWVRTARALENAGYTDKSQLAGVLSDKYLLFRNRSPLLKDFGKIANDELLAWLQAHENSVPQPAHKVPGSTASVVKSPSEKPIG